MTNGNIETVLAFEHISHRFAAPAGDSAKLEMPVLQDISLELLAGEIVCIVGPSGCGKSTLLNIAAGLITPTEGKVYSHGLPVVGPGVDRAMMFQEDTLFPWLTVRGNVAFGPRCQKAHGQLLDVDKTIALVGLSGYEEYRPSELSGGMRQRVALARALINHADILLLDEPFASLDAQTREAMQELLLDVHAHVRPCILLVTHDIEEAVFLGDRIVVLTSRTRGTRIGEITTSNLPRPRTIEMREDPRVVVLRKYLRDILRGLSDAHKIDWGKTLSATSSPAQILQSK